MNHYELASEGRRLVQRPAEDPIKLLGLLVIRPAGDYAEYAHRLRGLLAGAIEICKAVDFEQDEISVELLPSWFLMLSDGSVQDVQDDLIGSAGKRRYLEGREDLPWDSEEWIYCFDPDLRKWSWWDMTAGPEGTVFLWVDTKGEAHIPCEELWWAVFVSGAREADGLTLEMASIWRQQQSIGI